MTQYLAHIVSTQFLYAQKVLPSALPLGSGKAPCTFTLFKVATKTLVQRLATVVLQAYISILQLLAIFKLCFKFSSDSISFSTPLRHSLQTQGTSDIFIAYIFISI